MTQMMLPAEERQWPDTSKMIFVFGSNEAGIHGAGAAGWAAKHRGAVWSRGYGRYGQSFALPTKNRHLITLSLPRIQGYAKGFMIFAGLNPKLTFQITQLGCGLAGLKTEDIAPMFQKAPRNCLFDWAWKDWLPEHEFWGTYP